MKRFQDLLRKPTRLSDLSLEELSEEEDDGANWRIKAERLQARRWRKVMKRQMA